MELLTQVDETIQTRNLVPPRGRVVVAVSGGLDSMVLMHLLNQLAKPYRWQLTIAHFNHQLRGRASQADERCVRTAAQQLSLPYVTDVGNVREFASKKGFSLEMAARQLRHEFLGSQAKKSHRIALAHHAQDQVELFMLRILRGAGPGGLAGMQWSNPSPAKPSVTLIRPLLDVARSAIQDYARTHKIHFREDASNQSTDILRNRVRHRLLPLLQKEFQHSITPVVLRQMEILSQEDAFVSEALESWLRRSRRPLFSKWPVALQRRHLHKQLIEFEIQSDFALIESLRMENDRVMMVAPGRTLQRDNHGKLHLKQSQHVLFKEDTLKVSLSGSSGIISFQGWTLNWRRMTSKTKGLPKKQAQYEWFDADKVGKSIVLRHWRPGDRFQPIGMAGSVKLQDLFTNQKVPVARRRQLLLACTSEGNIWWVQGMRIGEGFKIRPTTRQRLTWRWAKNLAGNRPSEG